MEAFSLELTWIILLYLHSYCYHIFKPCIEFLWNRINPVFLITFDIKMKFTIKLWSIYMWYACISIFTLKLRLLTILEVCECFCLTVLISQQNTAKVNVEFSCNIKSLQFFVKATIFTLLSHLLKSFISGMFLIYITFDVRSKFRQNFENYRHMLSCQGSHQILHWCKMANIERLLRILYDYNKHNKN